MDIDDLTRLKAEHGRLEKTPQVSSVVSGFEQYARDGQAYGAELWDEEDLRAVVALLGVSTVKAEDIVRYSVINQVSGNETIELHADRPIFEGAAPFDMVLPGAADMQPFWEDEVNEYKATVIVRLDDTTAVAFGQTCTEPDDDEYVFRHWVGVFNLADIDNYPGLKDWNLEYVDIAALERAREARAIEREKAEGAINLSRLRAGDTVRLTTKRLQEMNPYARFTQEELDARFVDTFTVIEPGSQPICEVREGAPQIRLLGGGRWTNRRQNPVQSQDHAITPTYGFLYPNQHVMFALLDAEDFACSETIIESAEII